MATISRGIRFCGSCPADAVEGSPLPELCKLEKGGTDMTAFAAKKAAAGPLSVCFFKNGSMKTPPRKQPVYGAVCFSPFSGKRKENTP